MLSDRQLAAARREEREKAAGKERLPVFNHLVSQPAKSHHIIQVLSHIIRSAGLLSHKHRKISGKSIHIYLRSCANVVVPNNLTGSASSLGRADKVGIGEELTASTSPGSDLLRFLAAAFCHFLLLFEPIPLSISSHRRRGREPGRAIENAGRSKKKNPPADKVSESQPRIGSSIPGSKHSKPTLHICMYVHVCTHISYLHYIPNLAQPNNPGPGSI